MPENEMETKGREAMDLGELIHSAAGVVEQAIRMDDPKSKRALQDAAQTLLQTAIDRMDESVGAAVANMEEEDDE